MKLFPVKMQWTISGSRAATYKFLESHNSCLVIDCFRLLPMSAYTTTDGMAWRFSLNLRLQPGIELESAHLGLFEGPYTTQDTLTTELPQPRHNRSILIAPYFLPGTSV